jgi:alanyl-tRNA synthetase
VKSAAALRAEFLAYFERHGHSVKPSAPLIPQGDATLMFNVAGMVPFKPYFLGVKRDLQRAASSQKCFRTNDIDRVGTTVRHLTFFEMLGNFSFGDYFKAEAIDFAWTFLVKDMGFDPSRLYPTVFTEDDEAFELWRKHGTPNTPVRLGADSNFWAAGPTGPCGPCSEIYYDRGQKYSCGLPSCSVGCDCDRYLEIWNLVFMQFLRDEKGGLSKLPRQNIDTGMGLERLTFALQAKESPFETDLFMPIINRAQALLSKEMEHHPLAFRVIGDHARAATMLLAEGVIPSNVERGYVLRRLIRRSVRYGQLLGHTAPFMNELVPGVVEIFPDLAPAAKDAALIMKQEEERFLETLEAGERELGKLLEGAKAISGAQAFKLYDTFGFPFELTKEICAQKGVAVDEAGFASASEKAQETARASWKGSGQQNFAVSVSDATEFTGYESLQETAEVVAFTRQGDKGALVLSKSPFYPEGGGQVGDEGWVDKVRVVDTKKQGAVIIHVTDGGDFKIGQKVTAKVDAARRGYVRPHHTGTHLLNEALRRILGGHVRQAGSYVGADKLRFDFTHPKALDPEQIHKIEHMIEGEIKKGEPVVTKVDDVSKVKDYGALTLMGEDYGQRPRFVLIGAKGWADPKDRFSLELCGGTHCASTAEVKAFKIIKESSAAAGIRRIEAVAGEAFTDFQKQQGAAAEQTKAAQLAKVRELMEEVQSLGGKFEEPKGDLKQAERELRELISRLKLKKAGDSKASFYEVKGFKLAAQRVEGIDPKMLRGLADKAKSEVGKGLVFIAAPQNGKLSFVLAATTGLPVNAGSVAKAWAAAHGGSAGGREDFAQGGAADSDWNKLVEDLIKLI